MQSLNHVLLLGNVATNPEMYITPEGQTLVTFKIAITTPATKDKNELSQQNTDFHNVIACGKLGDVVGEYVKKGTALYIQGKLKNSVSISISAKKTIAHAIVADEIQLISSKQAFGTTEIQLINFPS